MKREAHGELADRPPPRRQARRGASKGSERKVCSDSEFVKDEWRIRRTTVLDEVFGEDPWRRVLTEATAGNLDEVDKAMDATVFADPEILPEPAAYDLKRRWPQVTDFDRWGIEPEKALFWTHVESQLGLSIPNGDTVPSIHWPGHDLGNSYVEVPPPESRIRIYPGRSIRLERFRPILLGECLSCPRQQVFRGEDRIRWETDILIGFGEGPGVLGWLRPTGGIEETHVLQAGLASSVLNRAWTGASNTDPTRGMAANLPLAIAYSQDEKPEILDFMWASGGMLLGTADLQGGEDPVLRSRLRTLGLDQLPPPSDGPPRKDPTVLYSRSRGVVLFIGGTLESGETASELLSYHLLSQRWKDQTIDNLELTHVAGAAFIDQDSSVWVFDVRPDNSRLIRIDLFDQTSTVEVSVPNKGMTFARFLAADRAGNLLVACDGVHGKSLFELDVRSRTVTAAWSLPSPLAMQPIADATGVRVVLQEDGGAPEIVGVQELTGFTPEKGWTELAATCLQ